MDQPVSNNPLASALPNITNLSLPSVWELFQTSWQNVKKNLLLLFIYNTVGLMCYLILTLFFMGIILASTTFQANTLIYTAVSFIVSALYLIGIVLLSNSVLTFNTIVLSENKNPSFKAMFTYSIKKSLPLIVIFILGAILIAGGLTLLIIPGIIFGMFFLFAPFISILENQGPISSLKRSAYLVSRSFGDIFIRLLLLLAIPVVVSIVLDNFQGGDLTLLLVGITGIVFNLLYGWFAVSYLLTLYKQSKQGADAQGQTKLRPIILVAAVGLVIGAILIASINYYNASVLNNVTPLPAFLESDADDLLDDELLFNPPQSTGSASQSPVPTPRASTASASASPR